MALYEANKVYAEEVVTRIAPENLKEEDNALFFHEYERELSDCCAYQYTDATISGRGLAVHGTIYRSRIVTQCITDEIVRARVKVKAFLQAIMYPTVCTLEKAILFTDTNSHGFFHFITDALPKLISIDKKILNTEYILLPEKYAVAFALQAFRLCGISESRIYIIPMNKKVKVKFLRVMEHLALPAGTGNFRPSTIQDLRKRITTHTLVEKKKKGTDLLHKFGRKIYISRSDANYRYLHNESELISILEDRGFTILCASHLNFEEQIALFSEAEVLLSLHGAGLTNMIWMPSGGKIAEIRLRNDSHNNCYFSLTNACGLHYYYVLSDADSKDIHKANMVLDRKALEQLLNEMHV